MTNVETKQNKCALYTDEEIESISVVHVFALSIYSILYSRPTADAKKPIFIKFCPIVDPPSLVSGSFTLAAPPNFFSDYSKLLQLLPEPIVPTGDPFDIHDATVINPYRAVVQLLIN